MNFKKILDLFNFKREFERLGQMETALSEKLEIQKEVDRLLASGNSEMYFKMIENGYVPTKEQGDKLDNLFENALLPFEEKLEVVFDLIDKGFILEPKHVEKIFFNCSFIIYAKETIIGKDEISYKKKLEEIYKNIYTDYFNCPEKYESRINEEVNKLLEKENSTNANKKNWCGLAHKIKPLIKEEKYSNVLLCKWIDIVKNESIHFDRLVADPYFIMRDVWKNKLTVEDYETILIKFNTSSKSKFGKDCQSSPDFFNAFKEDYNVLAEEKNQKLLKRVKSLYIENNVEKKAIETQQKITQNFSIKKLDKETQNIILEIENKCKKLENSTEIEIQFLVNNTLDKVLPETLRKYFSIDDEYRKSMTNKAGKNSYDLLLESLNNINLTLEKQLETKNEIGLKEMEVNAIYTRRLSS